MGELDKTQRVINVWITNEGKRVSFSTNQVWRDLRENRERVSWYNVVWFKGFEPKHAFIVWLAVLDRLNTQERMAKWIHNNNFSCALCGKVKDSISHLFFKCEYSAKVWGDMRKKLLFRGLPDDFHGILLGLEKYPGSKNIWNVINRMVFAACVYSIWQERNKRIFKLEKRNVDAICKDIQDFVKCKCLTFKVKHSRAILRFADLWDLKVVGGRLCM
ncbi:uncharacterized protein [Rutidosis leptorrhynchoides]|uniref:uncharacterized protein n=1 Tax=Rutidosis leptorrhynchoides TaxID=125765 RepID=UPI003A994E58